MNISLPHISWQVVILSLVVLFLIAAVFFGFRSGQALAQAERISQQKKQVEIALGYFYSDQGRFPSTVEFLDRGAFGLYIDSFPVPQVLSSECAKSLQYQANSSKEYSLTLCSPAAASGVLKGITKVTSH